MGLDITVLIVDWTRIERTPVGERLRLLEDAALPDDDDFEASEGVDWGWTWPPGPGAEAPWFARYEFHGTLGSFKPHFWAGKAWEDVREFAGPPLRAALDRFLSGLIWDGPDGEADHVHSGLLPDDADPWRPGLLLAHPPEALPALAASWAGAEPLLADLSDPFAAHAACPDRWTGNFEQFAALLRDWGEVVNESGRRGWGLVGLPL